MRRIPLALVLTLTLVVQAFPLIPAEATPSSGRPHTGAPAAAKTAERAGEPPKPSDQPDASDRTSQHPSPAVVAPATIVASGLQITWKVARDLLVSAATAVRSAFTASKRGGSVRPRALEPTTPAADGDGTPGDRTAGLAEIIERRTANSKTFYSGTPGRFIARVSGAPMHYREAAGRWADIDTALVEAAPGVRRSAANAFEITMREDPLSAELATLSLDADHSVGFGFQGALPVPPQSDRSSVAFRGLRPGVELKLISLPTQLKEEIVLDSLEAGDTFRFPLRLKGLTASIDPVSGSVLYSDASGTVRARTPTGYMEDSAVDPRTGTGARSYQVSYALSGGDARPVLEVRLNRAWLEDRAKVWPVTVDPILSPQPQAGFDDTTVQTGYTRDASADADLHVGTYTDGTGTHTTRSFLHFDLSPVHGKVINRAELYLYEWHAWSCSARFMDVYRVTSNWSGSQVTSFATPPSPQLGESISHTSFAGGYEPGGCGDGYKVLDTTTAVRNWTSSTWANQGIALISTAPESDVFGYKKFNSENAGVNVPLYNIDYSETNRDPAGYLDAATGVGGGVSLSGWAFDPDAPPSPIAVHVYVDGGFAGGLVANTHRPDVGAAFPGYGDYHGFSGTVPASVGSHTVCVYAINTPPGNNPLLGPGCRSVTVPNRPPSAPVLLEPHYTSGAEPTVNSATPTLRARSTDLDNHALVLRFYVFRASDLGQAAGGYRNIPVCSGCEDFWQVTPPLPDGRYGWTAWAFDGYGDGPATTPYKYFTVDTTAAGTQLVAESDELGLEQFYPYRSLPLGTGTGYVNLGTGNLVATFDDATIPGHGLNTVVRHTYNANRAADDGMGPGWSLSVADVDVGLDAGPGSVVDLAVGGQLSVGDLLTGVGGLLGGVLRFTDGDGTTHRFVRPFAGTWQSPPGVNLKVRELFGAYEIVRPDGVVWRAENVEPNILLAQDWRVRSVTDRNGNQLTYGYAKVGNAYRIATIDHSRSGRVAEFSYPSGRLDQIRLLPGKTALEPVTGATKSYERLVAFEYTAGALTKVTENAQAGSDGTRTTQFEYSGGRLSAVVDALGKRTALSYTGAALTKVTDRRLKDWEFTYHAPDAQGTRKTEVSSPLSSGPTGRPKDAVPQGDQVVYTVSPRVLVTGTQSRRHGGNVVAIADAGFGNGIVTTTYGWEDNRLRSSTDGAGAETRFTYDHLGLVTEVVEPAPNDPARGDLPAGAPTTATVNTLTYEYPDPARFGYPCPTGTCVAAGQLTKAVFGTGDAARRVTAFTYDATGNITEVAERERADGTPQAPSCSPTDGTCTGDRIWKLTYYAAGKGALRSVDGPRLGTGDTTTYGSGNPADAYGGYDPTGQPGRIVDAAGMEKQFFFSPWGLTVQVTDRDGAVTKSRYDDRDNLVEVLDPGGDRTRYAYDGNDSKTRETSPRGDEDPDPDDFTTIFTYDDNGWLTQTSWPGRLRTDPRPAATIVYDDDGAKRTETTPRAGSAVTYTYHDNRALKRIDAPGETTAQRALTDYEYDQAGRVTKTTMPAVNGAGDRPVRESTFSPAGLLSVESETSAVAGQLRTIRFAYNVHGEQIRADGPRTVGGVEQATEQVWDRFGQLILSRRRLDAARWIETVNGYDLAGNQVRTVQPTGLPTDNPAPAPLESLYRFNDLNQLEEQTKDPANPGHTVDYNYTGEGQQKTRVDPGRGHGRADDHLRLQPRQHPAVDGRHQPHAGAGHDDCHLQLRLADQPRGGVRPRRQPVGHAHRDHAGLRHRRRAPDPALHVSTGPQLHGVGHPAGPLAGDGADGRARADLRLRARRPLGLRHARRSDDHVRPHAVGVALERHGLAEQGLDRLLLRLGVAERTAREQRGGRRDLRLPRRRVTDLAPVEGRGDGAAGPHVDGVRRRRPQDP